MKECYRCAKPVKCFDNKDFQTRTMVITDRKGNKDIMLDPEPIAKCAVISKEIPVAIFSLEGITRK